MKRTFIFGLLLISIGIIIFILLPTGFSDEKIRIVRPLDFPQETIFKQIDDNHLVRSQIFLNFLLSILGPGKEIEPGAYQLTHRMNLWQVADTLLHHPYQKWVIFIPGLRKEQVGEILAKKFSWNDTQIKEFQDISKEGYLFPDTYLLNVDYSPKEMFQRLISNFNEKFTPQMQKDLLSQDVRVDTAVKIASLIQRESGGDSDKALIADIIWNRLDKKMALQIDATIQYALGKSGNWWPTVTSNDIKTTDSPYNTYI